MANLQDVCYTFSNNRTTHQDTSNFTCITFQLKLKPEDGLQCPRVDVDAFATSKACGDLDLWPPESNQVMSRG